MNQEFKKEILAGLQSRPKYLPSKYFYDKKGDALFQKIMSAPEYYLTNAELEIFQLQSAQIIEAFKIGKDEQLDLFELGAGDGTKTIELLKKLSHTSLTYKPIDISSNALSKLAERLEKVLPTLKVSGQQGEYFKVLGHIEGQKRKIILFLGSNLGNMEDAHAKSFLEGLANVMNPGDLLLMGLDLIKPKSVVLPAYNDAQGFTRDFNLNLLQRINDQLNANFCLEQFEHLPEYNEQTGYAKSYLGSRKKQSVKIGDVEISFEENERVFTEISRKYNDEILSGLLEKTGLQIQSKFTDSRQYFCDYLIEKQ